MIRHLEVSSFKSLRKASLDFSNINIFIGANGAGKTNILEAIGVVSAAAYGVVDDESLLRRGIRPGVPRLYKTSNKKYTTSPHIAFEVGNENCRYTVSLLNPLENPRPKWHFKTEKVFEHGKEYYSRGMKTNIDPENGGIPAILASGVSEELKRFFAELKDYALYNPNTPALRGLVPDMQNRMPVGLSGGGLSEGLQELLELAKKNDDLAGAIEDVEGLFDWVGDVGTSTQNSQILSASLPRTKRTITFTDFYMKDKYNRLTAADASEGILYALFLMVLCLSEHGPKVFSVDNIDQALNPRLVKAIMHLLQEWFHELVPEKQIFCTAHNPVVLDSLDLFDDIVRLFVVDRNSDGLTSIQQIKITPELIQKSKANHISLSQMWVDGYIGGVPNV